MLALLGLMITEKHDQGWLIHQQQVGPDPESCQSPPSAHTQDSKGQYFSLVQSHSCLLVPKRQSSPGTFLSHFEKRRQAL